MTSRRHTLLVLALSFSTFSLLASQASAESWEQYKFDSRHSGNAPKRQVKTPLKLAAAITERKAAKAGGPEPRLHR